MASAANPPMCKKCGKRPVWLNPKNGIYSDFCGNGCRPKCLKCGNFAWLNPKTGKYSFFCCNECRPKCQKCPNIVWHDDDTGAYGKLCRKCG